MVDLFYLIWLNLFVYPQDDLLRWLQTLSALEKIMKIFPDSLADKDVLHQFGTRGGAALSPAFGPSDHLSDLCRGHLPANNIKLNIIKIGESESRSYPGWYT